MVLQTNKLAWQSPVWWLCGCLWVGHGQGTNRTTSLEGKKKVKRNRNSSSCFVVEEMISNIDTVVTQGRLKKDLDLINLQTVCGLFSFSWHRSCYIHRGSNASLGRPSGSQLESFSVTKHALPLGHLPLREPTAGTWDLVLFLLTANGVSTSTHCQTESVLSERRFGCGCLCHKGVCLGQLGRCYWVVCRDLLPLGTTQVQFVGAAGIYWYLIC